MKDNLEECDCPHRTSPNFLSLLEIININSNKTNLILYREITQIGNNLLYYTMKKEL